jgi:PTH2 family peptidyl-tRNA hydrolase
MGREAKQVIVVRRDLKMGKGKIAAQVAHASVSSLFCTSLISSDTCVIPVSEAVKRWFATGQAKICLSCDSKEELHRLIFQAGMTGIRCYPVNDAGKTCFDNMPTLTCAGFGPDWSDELDKLTKHLKLL